MCGLFGWQWKNGVRPPRRQRDVLAAALAVFNDDRGGDSWGYFRPDVSRLKKGMGEMVRHSHVLASARSLIGHTRFATVGGKTVENAHPFHIGKVVGAHNGGIFNWSDLNKRYGRSFEVDSMHLIAHLAEGGDLSELTGYGAVTYLHADDPEAIALGRLTSSGDLAVVETPYGIVWSSDDKHLRTALEMARLEMKAEYDLAWGTKYVARGGVLFETEDDLEITSGSRVQSYGRTFYGDWDDWRNGRPTPPVQKTVELVPTPEDALAEVEEPEMDLDGTECAICLTPLTVDEMDCEEDPAERMCVRCTDWSGRDFESGLVEVPGVKGVRRARG